MKLTYIYQSSFILECVSVIFIFDYYRSNHQVHQTLLNIIENSQKKIFVLVSHSHHDHYNKEIFAWKNKFNAITYILSDEVEPLLPINISDLDIVLLEKYKIWSNESYGLNVHTYGSTDIGCSFFINIDEKTIFHAGDLNNWHWNEESSPSEIASAENYYHTELDIISKDVSNIDYLFFPIDQRLGKDYLKGVLEWIDKIKVKTLIPMHFGDSYPPYNAICKSLLPIEPNIKIIEMDKEGYYEEI